MNGRQFTKEQINDYLNGTMEDEVLFEFEAEIFTNLDLEKEVAYEVLKRMRKEKSLRALEQSDLKSEKDIPLQTNSTKKKSWFSFFFK